MSVSLHPITLTELKGLIAYAYLGDEDLINQYQADTNRTYEECIEFNFNEIKNLISDPNGDGDIFLWKITYHGTPIGYCVTISNGDSPSMLLSYSINKEYRRAIVLLQWLHAVEEEIGTPYYTGLWTKNTRAIGFFEKNGFVRFKGPGGREDYVYLVKNPELLDKDKLLGTSAVLSD